MNYYVGHLAQEVDKGYTHKKKVAYWRNLVHQNGLGTLSENQKKRVLEFYKLFKKVTTDFPSFYYTKTGSFDGIL